jgi:hypothetical protein
MLECTYLPSWQKIVNEHSRSARYMSRPESVWDAAFASAGCSSGEPGGLIIGSTAPVVVISTGRCSSRCCFGRILFGALTPRVVESALLVAAGPARDDGEELRT